MSHVDQCVVRDMTYSQVRQRESIQSRRESDQWVTSHINESRANASSHVLIRSIRCRCGIFNMPYINQWCHISIGHATYKCAMSHTLHIQHVLLRKIWWVRSFLMIPHYMYIYTCICVYTYSSIYGNHCSFCTYIYVYIYSSICNMHMWHALRILHVYMYECICVYMYMCIYVYVYSNKCDMADSYVAFAAHSI